MAYADSAIDYVWEIAHLDVSQRLMTVKYDTADSSDSARPSVFLNHIVSVDQFNESDLTTIATTRNAEERVVSEWDKVIESNTANPSFDANTLIGNSYSSRYKVRSHDSVPSYNPLTHSRSTYDSEGADDICTKYTVSAMNDSDKTVYRNSIIIQRRNFWEGLEYSNYLTTATNALVAENSLAIPALLNEDTVSFGDSISGTVQTALSLNDSDWAAWLLTAGIV